jgi:hypothetical protein
MDLLHIAHGNHDWLTPEEEDAVLQRLAARARVFVRGEAWQVLTQRASKARLQPRELLQRDIVPAAILLVIAESMTPQRLQIGRTRLGTPEGTWPPLSPMSLLPWQYVKWFWQQVPKAVTAFLLDQPYPQTPPAPPVEWVAPEVALSPEAIVQARSLLHAVWHVASPQQQDILRLLLLEESTVAEVAARLRVRRAHVYAQLDRLQAKIQDL